MHILLVSQVQVKTAVLQVATKTVAYICDLNLRKVAELRTKFRTTIESVLVWSGEFNLFYTDSFSGVNIMSYVNRLEKGTDRGIISCIFSSQKVENF